MHYGFIVITLAWLWQYWKMRTGMRSLDPWFLRLSAVGFLIVVLDTFKISNWLSWASAVALVIILLLVWKVRR